jgi:hypothetical protein
MVDSNSGKEKSVRADLLKGVQADLLSTIRCAVITEFARIQLGAKGIQSEWRSRLLVGRGSYTKPRHSLSPLSPPPPPLAALGLNSGSCTCSIT